ncbi:MAG: VTT domain-containing protein, partial [Calditrichaeota bacterium]|nr:VTT domain-containing protein [Calditrichota bacterium]
LLSAIGVQEFELLGDYHLNHAVHGAQLFLIWLLQEGTPHFGRLDHFPLNLPYARSFYDSDQRPLREYLQAYQGPMLIQHGPEDGLVPFAAAREHQRIVPQSVLQVYERGGHGIVMGRAEQVAGDICRFIETVEAGAALTRTAADPQRIAAAAQPLESDAVQKAEGITLFVFIILIALATFVSEDLACIGAGLMAARGIIGFLPAVFASFLGIFVGDMLLYLAGRYFGKPALKYPPLKWMIKEADIAKSANWFREKGPRIILASRFLPGSRLPTYFGAGMLDAGFWMFTFYFGIAALAWTPLLVGLATLIGEQLLDYYAVFHKYALLVLLGAVLLVWSIPRLLLPLFSHQGRRLLLSRWRRLTRWEFWPPYVFYVPVVFYVLYLGLRHRSLTLFTAANPGIPAGGFIGESKSEILDGLQGSGSAVARYHRIDTHQPLEGQIAAVTEFMDTHQLDFPVVLKPDAGQRGSGVGIIRSETQLRDYLRNNSAPAMVQEYMPGEEFGVFYYRYPGEESGHIFSITDKRFIAVRGDGQSTLETLILNDARAVCMAPFHLAQHRERLQEVPAAGATVPLVELGTHCRGALFLDGSK